LHLHHRYDVQDIYRKERDPEIQLAFLKKSSSFRRRLRLLTPRSVPALQSSNRQVQRIYHLLGRPDRKLVFAKREAASNQRGARRFEFDRQPNKRSDLVASLHRSAEHPESPRKESEDVHEPKVVRACCYVLVYVQQAAAEDEKVHFQSVRPANFLE